MEFCQMVKKENSELDSENNDQFMFDRNCLYILKSYMGNNNFIDKKIRNMYFQLAIFRI
jgi:hypothetical protein